MSSSLSFSSLIEYLALYNSAEEASVKVADTIAAKINAFNPTESKPFVIGLPTGSSPLKVYARLIELYKQGKVDFSNVVSFNMDEYYQLPPSNPESYHYFMYTNFFNHVNFKPENINILNGLAEDWEKECQRYEAKIKSYGKINFFLGGMGPEGHIAFNESGSKRDSKTRRIKLVDSTIKANSRFFGGDLNKVPKSALTVGISTVLDNSEEVLVVVFGKGKNWALLNTLTRKPTSAVPGTFLKTHPNSIIVADYDAIEGEASTAKI
ncbi:DEKNAAC100741 [Brettanomyces naardenensis]|uniref:Glucosamine-6-phosphate isomerase n=1 Tax=Brettanomyces naardenensis TaxID=13370 RepID=A0A448YFU2_BRENA|nr:DEKNAAC100741 [Brettanomyces naardenensis]